MQWSEKECASDASWGPWVGPTDVLSDSWGQESLCCRLFPEPAGRKPARLKEGELVGYGRMLGAGGTHRGHDPSSMPPLSEPRAQRWRGRWWDPESLEAASWPRISQRRLRKIWGHTWVHPSFLWASVLGLLTTSSNWLIFPHLSGSQLHWLSWASAEREAESQKGKKKLLSHYSYSFPYSPPHPLAVSTAMPLSSSSFLKDLFITIFSFMWREPLASVQWPVCGEILLPSN